MWMCHSKERSAILKVEASEGYFRIGILKSVGVRTDVERLSEKCSG